MYIHIQVYTFIPTANTLSFEWPLSATGYQPVNHSLYFTSCCCSFHHLLRLAVPWLLILVKLYEHQLIGNNAACDLQQQPINVTCSTHVATGSNQSNVDCLTPASTYCEKQFPGDAEKSKSTQCHRVRGKFAGKAGNFVGVDGLWHVPQQMQRFAGTIIHGRDEQEHGQRATDEERERKVKVNCMHSRWHGAAERERGREGRGMRERKKLKEGWSGDINIRGGKRERECNQKRIIKSSLILKNPSPIIENDQ